MVVGPEHDMLYPRRTPGDEDAMAPKIAPTLTHSRPATVSAPNDSLRMGTAATAEIPGTRASISDALIDPLVWLAWAYSRPARTAAMTPWYTARMDLLQEGVDRSLIAPWLGHESVETTQIYLDANLAIKQAVLDKTTPPEGTPGRYRPDDRLLAFLKGL